MKSHYKNPTNLSNLIRKDLASIKVLYAIFYSKILLYDFHLLKRYQD